MIGLDFERKENRMSVLMSLILFIANAMFAFWGFVDFASGKPLSHGIWAMANAVVALLCFADFVISYTLLLVNRKESERNG